MSNLPFYHIVRKSSIKDKQSPLLLMVHGFGSNEQDLFSFSRAIPSEFTIVSLRGPINTPGMGYAWYDIYFDLQGNKTYDIEMAIKSRDLILKCVKDCSKKYNTDIKNTTLMGFSQGSVLINAVALTYPKNIKNIISMSGGIDPNIITLSRHNLNDLSFYISHGTEDEVLPFNQAKESLDFLNQNKIIFDFETYPVGHGVCSENFKSMLSWLNKKML